MFRSVCFVSLIVVLVVASVYADATGAIAGRVVGVHGFLKTPLEGASIRATAINPPGGYLTCTDAYGLYDIPTVETGWYLMIVSKSGYENGYAIVRVRFGRCTTQDFELIPVD